MFYFIGPITAPYSLNDKGSIHVFWTVGRFGVREDCYDRHSLVVRTKARTECCLGNTKGITAAASLTAGAPIRACSVNTFIRCFKTGANIPR